MGADQNSLHTDQRSLPGIPTEEEKGVDHNRYLESRTVLKKKVMDTRAKRLKERYRQQYREADKKVKRMTTADKQAYMEDLASQAEEATNRGEQRQVYKIIKLVSGKYRGTTVTPIVDKQGRSLTTETEKEARWAKHFSEVLNRLPPTIEAEIQDPDTDLDVSTTPPEKEEIMAAIRSLKNGKARDKTASTPSSSRQNQSLQHKFFNHSLQQYGRRNNYLTTGGKVSS